MAALPLRATPSKCFSKEAPAASAWKEQPFLLLLVIVAVVAEVATAAAAAAAASSVDVALRTQQKCSSCAAPFITYFFMTLMSLIRQC